MGFVDFELVVDIILGADIVGIVAGVNLELSVLPKDLHIVRVGFDFLIDARNLLAVLIDGTVVDVQLVDVIRLLRLSSEVESINLYPHHIFWEAIVHFCHNRTQFILVGLHILRNNSNIAINSLF